MPFAPGTGVLAKGNVVKIIGWIIGVPLALVILVFSVANRGNVAVDMWPLPIVTEIPIYLIAFAGLALGLIVGIFTMGIAAFFWRSRARRYARRMEASRKEAGSLREELEEARKAQPVLALPQPDHRTVS